MTQSFPEPETEPWKAQREEREALCYDYGYASSIAMVRAEGWEEEQGEVSIFCGVVLG
jgi:hypothetical protein